MDAIQAIRLQSEDERRRRHLIKTWPREWEWDEWTTACEEWWEAGNVTWYYCRGVPRKLALAEHQDSFLYLVHRGAIRGAHKILRLVDFGGLRTMKTWDGSVMLVRGVIECEGPILPVDPPIPMSGFQGFRYFAGMGRLERVDHR